MRQTIVILLATLQFLLVNGAFAAACDTGPATGVGAPVVTHLRSYPWDFHSPTRMALRVDSSLLISDPERSRIITREASGRITDKHAIAGNPVSVAVDAQDRIYLGDDNLGQVGVYSRNWELLFNLGIGAGEFQLPGAIAVHPVDGRIYVVDSKSHQLRVFNGDGSPNFTIGGFGDGQGLFKYPAGIFLDAAAGEIFIADQLNYQVQVLDMQGGYLRCIGGTNASPGSFFGSKRPLNQPQGVWVDNTGRVLVSDAAEGQIKVFDRNGNALTIIGAFGSKPGELRIPMDLVVDAHQRLFIASTNNARLEVFGLDDYQDPESIAPAILQIEPDSLDRDAVVTRVKVAVELPGYRLDAILPGTLLVNGIPPLSVTPGDADRDHNPDLTALFDAATLLQTLPLSGDTYLNASATLTNGFQLEGEAEFVVLSSDLDADRDGVNGSFDLCPDTADGELTDADGCSVAQLCPCDGRAEEAWRNHGHYLVCVIREAQRVGEHHGLPQRQFKSLVPFAAGSQCGKEKQGTQQSTLNDKVDKSRRHE